MLRLAAKASCALAALCVSNAEAQSATVNEIKPLYGNIAPFYGNIAPFYGNIAPFYGNIAPFYGNIAPFYGNIAPFYGNIAPFYGNIAPFWGAANPFTPSTDIATSAFYGTKYDPFWGVGATNPYTTSTPGIVYSQVAGFWKNESANWSLVQGAWANATTSADAANVATLLQTTVLNPASTFWATAILKAPAPPPPPGTPAPPHPTASLVLTKLLSDAGVTFKADGSINPDSLLGLSQSQQAMLFLNLYDRLMDYSGTGHADWWMGKVGWSPALAAVQGKVPGGGLPPTVGMLDFVVSSGTQVSKKITQYGSTAFNDGHGAAVASLIMGSVDGSGVMGVMPQNTVKVVVYDPYDDTNTTNWADVGTGISTLSSAIFGDKATPVGVLNASLGVPGWTLHTGWNDALVTAGAHGHDLVIAAGNDGATQTQNVPWNFATNPTIIIVGSVGVDGTISNFSNRPGEACLLPDASTVCSEANKLKYRFIVAPGELILVSDGMGGHVRQSGTSLAAPLVSGAIAMLQNRWPWLAKYSDETAQIILQSATPMGANPGADADYGVGMLNILASQSPLDWSNLQYRAVVGGKIGATVPLSSVLTQVKSGTQATFDASNLYFTALETIGNTYRDFQIPLSAKLIGQNVTTSAGGQLYQSYLSSALRAQASHFAQLNNDLITGAPSLGFESTSIPAGKVLGMTLRLRMSPKETQVGFNRSNDPYQADAALVGENMTLQFGSGAGAAAIDGHVGFGFRSDYDVNRGGANPLLGLASGGGYFSGRFTVAPRLTASFGSTQRRDARNLSAFGLTNDRIGVGVGRYTAQAQQIGLDYAVSSKLTLRTAFTRLHEGSALLGVQSLDAADLPGGSTTTGGTLGFDLALPRGFMLTGSGTIANTRATAGQLATAPGGLFSRSAEVALAKSRLFAANDYLRLTAALPMRAMGSGLRYSSVAVIDRQTGELGVVSQSLNPSSGQTPFAGEIMYGQRLPKGGEFSLFGRTDAGTNITGTAPLSYTGGIQFDLHL